MKDPLDKIFVNCNRLKEDEARRVLRSGKELSTRKWKWDAPMELQDINKSLMNNFRSETMIGLGRWKNTKELFICISNEGNLTYLTPEIVKIMYNSIKHDAVHAVSESEVKE